MARSIPASPDWAAELEHDQVVLPRLDGAAEVVQCCPQRPVVELTVVGAEDLVEEAGSGSDAPLRFAHEHIEVRAHVWRRGESYVFTIGQHLKGAGVHLDIADTLAVRRIGPDRAGTGGRSDDTSAAIILAHPLDEAEEQRGVLLPLQLRVEVGVEIVESAERAGEPRLTAILPRARRPEEVADVHGRDEHRFTEAGGDDAVPRVLTVEPVTGAPADGVELDALTDRLRPLVRRRCGAGLEVRAMIAFHHL